MSTTETPAQFARIRATGRDRAKFLHNFCTNQIKEQPAGTAREAFFCDVKGKTLAHGFVLALETSHEIWILPGDPAALLKHLSRYVITEDVQFELLASSCLCISLSNNPTAALVQTKLPEPPEDSMSCRAYPDDETTVQTTDLVTLRLEWNTTAIMVVAGSDVRIADLESSLRNQNIPLMSNEEFHRLRISARFPIIGRDLSSDNLAPEAERNSTAISYTKGCYLGQEPIARLDAMGHVNRALRVVHIATQLPCDQIEERQIVTSDGTAAGVITSAVKTSSDEIHGLAMLRVAAFAKPLHIALDSGVTASVQVQQP